MILSSDTMLLVAVIAATASLYFFCQILRVVATEIVSAVTTYRCPECNSAAAVSPNGNRRISVCGKGHVWQIEKR